MNIESIQEKALTIPEQAQAFQVATHEQYVEAGNFLINIKDLKKKIEEHHNPIIDAAHLTHKTAIAAKKKFTEPLDKAESIIKPKIGSYLAEEERKRIVEQERLQREAQAKAEAEALERAVEAENNGDRQEAAEILEEGFDVPAVIVPKSTPKVDGISMRTTWKYRIKDQRQIKSEYMMPDEKKIGAIVRAMGKEAMALVGGIEVYPESVVAAGRRMVA